MKAKRVIALCALALSVGAALIGVGHVKLEAVILPAQDANWFVGHSHVFQDCAYKPCYRLTLGRLNLRAVPPYVDPNLPRRYYTAAILFVVKDEAGRPIRGAQVSCEAIRCTYPNQYLLMLPAVVYRYPTDKRGMYEIRRKVPGEYWASAAAEGYQGAMQTVQVGPDAVGMATITLHKSPRSKPLMPPF